jgi:hypothetical protein
MTLGLAFALGLSGCFLAFEREDAAVGGDGSRLDAGLADGGRDAASLDAGPCFTDRGVQICGTEQCPRRSEGGCRSCLLPDDSEAPGYCIQPRTDRLFGGIPVWACPHGDVTLLLVDDPDRLPTFCADPLACLAVQEDGWGRCFYADGTEVRTGRLAPAGACRGIEDLACGSGCRSCPEGQDCLGPSEASGLGFCVPADELFFDRTWCGDGIRLDERRDCGSGERCLRFVTAPSPSLPGGEVVGECMAADDCERLAAARPDRFRCESRDALEPGSARPSLRARPAAEASSGRRRAHPGQDRSTRRSMRKLLCSAASRPRSAP